MVRSGIKMRNHSLFLWVLLFMDGVFSADEVKPVSVMKGDSVTLHTGVSEVQRDNIIDWMNEDNDIIAQIKNNKTSTNYGRFEGRLEMDHQTGSLTIRNITSEHEGLYKLDIRGGQQIFKSFNVTVHDVVVSVSVMEGDSVTLHTGVTNIQRADVIKWFGDQGAIIADLNSAADERRSNIHLNNQTGDLTIRNIQIKQSGVYKVEINTNSMILHRKLKITVGGVNNITVKVGESATLSTSLIKIEGYDLILWKFEDHIITEINEGTNKFLLHDSSYERFRGRLQRNEKTGSLTISDSRTTDSGVYHLNMSSSSHSLQRTISLTVSALSLSSRDILMIFCGGGGGVLVGVAVALAFYCHKKSRRETQRRFSDNKVNPPQDQDE